MISTYYNRGSQIAQLCFGLVMLLIALSMIIEPQDAIFGWFTGAAALAAIGRSALAPSVRVEPTRLVLRGVYRTQTLQLAQVARAEASVGVTGFNSGEREYLALVLRDGRVKAFPQLNSRPGSTGSPVALACEQINRLLHET